MCILGGNNMTIENLCGSIYLGDRCCIGVDVSDERIKFQIDLISRLEEGTSEWNYYNNRNIENGYIVFDKLVNYSVKNGTTINDEIEIHYLSCDNGIYHFRVEGAEYSSGATSYNWVTIDIACYDFYLLDGNNIIRD